MSTISVVGVPSSAGSYAAGQDQAPAVLRSAGLITALRASGLKVQDEGDLRLQIWRPDRIRPRAQNIDQVTESIQELIERLTPHPQPAAYGPIHDQSVVQTLPDVSLDYAADHLLDAVRSVAVSKGPLHTRLQTAWVESVQHVWEKPCLTTELLARFKALWDRVTDRLLVPGAQGFGN